MAGKKLNRRDFLRLGALSAAGAAAVACAPTAQVIEKEVIKEVEVTKVVEVEKEVVKEVEVGGKEVRFTSESWCWEKLNMANATDHYNRELRDNNAGYQIVVDMAPQEYDTKVVQMTKDNELIWNGHMRSTNLGHVVRQYELGILQPWDEYINASSQAWAGQFCHYPRHESWSFWASLASVRPRLSSAGVLATSEGKSRD